MHRTCGVHLKFLCAHILKIFHVFVNECFVYIDLYNVDSLLFLYEYTYVLCVCNDMFD